MQTRGLLSGRWMVWSGLAFVFLAGAAWGQGTVLLSDNFSSYSTQNWGPLPVNVTIDNDTLRVVPPTGQSYASSSYKYQYVTWEARVKFNRLSTDSTIFYYLGFQSVIPWCQNICWFMVQDNMLFAASQQGGGSGFSQSVGYVSAGQYCTLKMVWTATAIQYFVNDVQVCQTQNTAAIPNVAMPVFLSANTNVFQGLTADLAVDWVKVTGDGTAGETTDTLLNDDFSAYWPQDWSALMTGAQVQNGLLKQNPQTGQIYVASQRKFQFATLETRVRFNTLSTDSTVFYYLGFQSVNPWVGDVCWLTVQDGVVFASAKRSDGTGTRVQVYNVSPGVFYDLKFVWQSTKVEMWINNAKVYETADVTAIPQTGIYAFLAANTIGTGPVKANLDVDSVKISGKAAAQDFAMQALGNAGTSLVKVQGGTLLLENPSYACQFKVSQGVRWDSLRNKAAAADCLSPDNQTPVFMCEGNGFFAPSDDFFIESIGLTDNGTTRTAVLDLWHSLSRLETVLQISADATDVMTWSLKVKNAGDNKTIQMVYPILGRVSIGGVDQTQYFYPWRSGIVGSVNCEMVHEYGGLAWMQVISMFNPQSNAGVYIYPKDSTGEFKGLVFQKNSPAGNTLRLSENVQSLEYPPQAVLDSANGIGLAYYYMARELAGGSEYNLPTTVFSIYQGTWKRALTDYSAWAHTWYNHVDTPAWYKRSFNASPQHPAGYYSTTTGKYIASDNHAYGTDIYQWAFWDNYTERPDLPFERGLAKFQPGDFLYNESRGGLSTFKAEIQKLQQKGARMTVYIDHRFCWMGTTLGTQHGQAWAAMYSPGEYGYYPIPEDKYCMCFYEPGAWADYIATTCGRIIQDTGMDGIYLDELPLPFPCYNPAHAHYQANPHPAAMGQLMANIQAARAAMVQANPQAILMTEHAGSDYASQFIDGCWSETFYKAGFPFAEADFDGNSLNYFRFCFPEFTQTEWGGSDDAPHRCFFNGMGLLVDMGDRTYLNKTGQVLRENGDAFSSVTPEPLVATKVANILANKFPAGEKTAYTVYNKIAAAVCQEILEADSRAGTHYVELLYDLEPVVSSGQGKDHLLFNINADEVVCVGQFPAIVQCTLQGTVATITLSRTVTNPSLRAFLDEDTSYIGPTQGVAVALVNGQGTLNVQTAFGRSSGKLILKLSQDGTLLDEKIVTASGSGNSVQGAVTLDGYAGYLSMVGLRVEFRPVGGGAAVVRNTLLDANGAFQISGLSSGTYNVAVKACAWLQKVIPGVIVSANPASLGVVTLYSGDNDGDNKISSTDLSVVLSQMNTLGN